MLEIVYISNADRDRLVLLQEAQAFTRDPAEQQRIADEIQEIHKRKKPLNECTSEECNELKTAMYEKFEKLNRIGKNSHAIQLKKMMASIELRQAQLHREQIIAEAERKAKSKDKHKKLAEQIADKEKPKKAKSTSSSRWMTGIGNLD